MEDSQKSFRAFVCSARCVNNDFHVLTGIYNIYIIHFMWLWVNIILKLRICIQFLLIIPYSCIISL